jgi:hypothetical protein
MRRVIVQMSMSLDGFVAPASGAEDHRAAPQRAASSSDVTFTPLGASYEYECLAAQALR